MIHPSPTQAQPPLPGARLARTWRLLAALLLIVGLAGLAATIHAAQVGSRHALEVRFEERSTVASRFAALYVQQMFARERTVARQYFEQRRVSPREFRLAADAFEFSGAVLLDARGRILAIQPAGARRLGSTVGSRYADLQTALHGHDATSPVAPSVARAAPSAAFDIPFQTPYGRRVFSGNFDAGKTPLSAFMRSAFPSTDSQVYLVDRSGMIVASNEAPRRLTASLAGADSYLYRAAQQRSGAYQLQGMNRFYAVRPVTGTSWRLMLSIKTSLLYAFVSGANLWLPWALLVAFAIGALAVLWLLFRYAQSRARLFRLNEELQFMAFHDSLTGLANRRLYLDQLEEAVDRTERDRRSFAILLVDLDGFKYVNDTLGHQAGDTLLELIAGRLRDALQDGETLARLGGDEFAVILNNGDEGDAVRGALNLLKALADLTHFHGRGLRLTASVGIACAPQHGIHSATLMRHADAAMYSAKRAGGGYAVYGPESDLPGSGTVPLIS